MEKPLNCDGIKRMWKCSNVMEEWKSFKFCNEFHRICEMFPMQLTVDTQFWLHSLSAILLSRVCSVRSSRTYPAFSPRNSAYDKSISRAIYQFSALSSRISSTYCEGFALFSALSAQSTVIVNQLCCEVP